MPLDFEPTHGDVSGIPHLVFESPYLTLGILYLASILHNRRGLLRMSPEVCCPLRPRQRSVPHTAGSSDTPYRHQYAVGSHFLHGIDWSRKHIDVHNLLNTNTYIDKYTALVPFRDLVPLDDQPIGERFFRLYPRQLGPCPRLTCVKLNVEELIEYFGWVGELDSKAKAHGLEDGGKPMLLSTCADLEE
ncbi:hypothetical protein BCR44DRAFT_40395 [Catenaria anguillulae PL171]|uniref:Uncharacterized protein n=1 Tax=Catenaria anguillulae PL171 TaxID=765915 RepID=A0A1Y2H7N7_9FUNG|nr:hypothetical protein BCR44DRAFT_40395 [Catenaria anguillulae PL171]